MILETSFLIDLMEGDERAVAEARRIESARLAQRIPAIVLYELFVGVGYSDRADAEVEKIRSVIEARPFEQLTPAIAAMAGRIDGKLQRNGTTISPPDVIVGATARHHGEPVVTANPADFERIPEVSVRSYK